MTLIPKSYVRLFFLLIIIIFEISTTNIILYECMYVRVCMYMYVCIECIYFTA